MNRRWKRRCQAWLETLLLSAGLLGGTGLAIFTLRGGDPGPSEAPPVLIDSRTLQALQDVFGQDASERLAEAPPERPGGLE